jgi:small subunit ribosomal protein S20
MANLSAAKKMIRVNKRRTKNNKVWRNKVKTIVKKFRDKSKNNETATQDEVKELYKVLDKAAKKHVIHQNKANRLKSSLTQAVEIKS